MASKPISIKCIFWHARKMDSRCKQRTFRHHMTILLINLISRKTYLKDLCCSFAHERAQSVSTSCKALYSVVCHQMAPRYAQDFQVRTTNTVKQHQKLKHSFGLFCTQVTTKAYGKMPNYDPHWQKMGFRDFSLWYVEKNLGKCPKWTHRGFMLLTSSICKGC